MQIKPDKIEGAITPSLNGIVNQFIALLRGREAASLGEFETKQILGAAILGVGGDEVIHVLRDFMYAKAPYTVHPVREAHSSDGR